MIKRKTQNNSPTLRITRRPKTLREIALERMRTAIHEFHFRPGQRLVERDVCEQLGVSRSVVREVMRQLEAEGLVHNSPHQGPSVATLDSDSAKQIYELRSLLESSAAQSAANEASAQDIALMEAALEKIETSYHNQDHQGVLAATTEFYRTMFLCGDKSIAWEIVQRLNGRIGWLRSMTIASPGRVKTGPAQLQKILSAIKERRGDAAAAACRSHVATAAAIAQVALREHLNSEESNDAPRLEDVPTHQTNIYGNIR